MRYGIDEREEDVARDFAEVCPRYEIMLRLEMQVDRLPVDFTVFKFIVERRPGKHGLSVVGCTPFGVDHHRASRSYRRTDTNAQVKWSATL